MSPLELKKIKLELIKVAAARHELEFKIDERLEEIDRIRSSVKIQLDKEQELTLKIKEEEDSLSK